MDLEESEVGEGELPGLLAADLGIHPCRVHQLLLLHMTMQWTCYIAYYMAYNMAYTLAYGM